MKTIKVLIEFSKGLNNKQALSLIDDIVIKNVYALFTNFLQSNNVGEEVKYHFKGIYCTDFTDKSFCLCFEFGIFDSAAFIVSSFIRKNSDSIKQIFKTDVIRDTLFNGEYVDVVIVNEGKNGLCKFSSK